MSTVYKLPFLKCSFPGCRRTVGYHRKGQKGNKQTCDYHRKKGKWEIEQWKLESGCANKDSHYGFECVSSQIIHPATLDINHIDGNNHNRDPENIEILCKMCHTVVTLNEKHHLDPVGKRKHIPKNNFGDIFV
jgi:hypothetical protein